jgi:hypothetical protein
MSVPSDLRLGNQIYLWGNGKTSTSCLTRPDPIDHLGLEIEP